MYRPIFFLRKCFFFYRRTIQNYHNLYTNLYFFKKSYAKVYDSLSADFAADTVFYELFFGNNNFSRNNLILQDFICATYFYERFNAIDFNISCFNKNCVFAIANLSNIPKSRTHDTMDFFFYAQKMSYAKNLFITNSLLLLPLHKDEYLTDYFFLEEEEILDQSFFFLKYHVYNDYYTVELISEHTPTVPNFYFCDYDMFPEFYKFCSMLLITKIVNN